MGTKEKKNYPLEELAELAREIPTAPPTNEGNDFRLKKINEIENYFKSEITIRESLSKKYFRASRILDNINTVLVFLTTAGAAGGLGLSLALVSLPAGMSLEGLSIFFGLISLGGKFFSNNFRVKAEKHEKIKIVASTKLNTISNHVSKALSDNFISQEEFTLISEELEKYNTMKEEIRSKSRKVEITSEQETALIERGRKEGVLSFRKAVEKVHGGPLEY